MRTRYLTRKGTSAEDSKQQFEQRTPYARDVIADGNSLDLRAFLDARGALAFDARMAEGLLAPTSSYARPAYPAYRMGGEDATAAPEPPASP